MAQPLAQVAEVCVAPPGSSLQLWRALIDWLCFLFQIFLQIVPSLSQILTHLRLSQSSSSSFNFDPLPVVELHLSESTPAAAPLPHAGSDGGNAGGNQCLEKLTVVLDLDETLICAYETSSLPEFLRAQALEAGLKCFQLECVSSDKECEGKPKISHITVFERPGLHVFLKNISEFADLVLFTAGLEAYASPLVDKIDVENHFSSRLYRPSTVSTKFREHVKDLSCLSKDLCRLVIVDNNPFSFLLQPLNGIPCIPFSVGQPYDQQLLDVLLPLLKHLSLQKDVRPVLRERFHLPEWFQLHGIPTSDVTV